MKRQPPKIGHEAPGAKPEAISSVEPEEPSSTGQSDYFEAHRRHRHDLRLERLRLLADRKRNPLYIWQAIAYAHVMDEAMPAWCNEYITDIALQTFGLIQSVIGPEYGITINASEGHAHLQILTPAKAAERMHDLLLITRQGYNAFEALEEDEKTGEDAAYVDLAFWRQEWRTQHAYDHLPSELQNATPELVEAYLDRRWGTLAEANGAVEIAMKKVAARRSIGKTPKGEGSDRQIKTRIKKGRLVLDPNKLRPPPGR